MVSSSLPRGYVGYSLSHEVILIAFGSAFDADCAASAANCPDSDRGRVCEPLSVSEAISCARSFDLHASSMRQSNNATYAVPMTLRLRQTEKRKRIWCCTSCSEQWSSVEAAESHLEHTNHPYRVQVCRSLVLSFFFLALQVCRCRDNRRWQAYED